MTSKCLVSELLAKIQLVRPALSAQKHVPILSHVCFTGEDLYAFDDIAFAQEPFETDFAGAVPGEMLLQVLRAYPATAEVALSKKKAGLELAVKGRKTSTKLPMLEVDQFLFDSERYDAAKKCLKFTEGLQNKLKRVLLGVGDSGHRVSMTGVVVTPEGTLWSTDNVTLTVLEEAHAGFKNKPFVLPKRLVEMLVAVELDDDDWTLHVSHGNYASLRTADTLVLAHSLAEGDPEEYGEVLDSVYGPGNESASLPEDFGGTVNRALAITRDDSRKVIRLASDGKGLHVSAESTQGVPARIDDEFDVKGLTKVECTVPAEAVSRALRHFGSVMGMAERALGFFAEDGVEHYISYSATE
jgi:DNA polymerase III sliding clamp (beta) subunit (PCNA family)